MDAYFSADRRFRYTLTREWDAFLPKIAFIGLNPSTADETQDDPTIRRCIGFSRAWGFGSLMMLNLYAFRATKPDDMWKAQKQGVDIIGGMDNWVDSLKSYTSTYPCSLVIAAWGVHGKERGSAVKKQWPDLYCLALNQDGSPKHPLYLKGSLEPIKW